jgi:hypothetical protein
MASTPHQGHGEKENASASLFNRVMILIFLCAESSFPINKADPSSTFLTDLSP